MIIGGKKHHEVLWIALFLLPNTLLYTIYTIAPAVMTAIYSLFDWNGFQASGTFYGIRNSIELFHDNVFFQSLKATFLFMLVVVPLRFLISLGFGLLLNSSACKFRSFFRTLLFLPVVTTGAIIGTIMIMIFDPSHGPVNIVLEKLGMLASGTNLLGSFDTALYTSGVIWTWKWMGMSLIYWIASLQSIPSELYEAAKIDGCGPFRIYWSVILPNCKSIIIYIIISVFNSYWGDYYGPLLYMPASDAPIPFAYAIFKSTVEGLASTRWAAVRMAGGVFMTFFPTLLFIIFQEQLTDGALTSGIKG